MTRLSAEVEDAAWGDAMVSQAIIDNEEMMARAAAIDTDAIEGWAFVQCGWCIVGAALVIVAAILLLVILCGGL